MTVHIDGIHKAPSSWGGRVAAVSKDARQLSWPRKLVAEGPIRYQAVTNACYPANDPSGIGSVIVAG